MSDRNDWTKTAEAELRGRALADLKWETLEGIEVKPLYTADDSDGLPHMGGVPGVPPYTRGVKATMYAGRPWTIRQYCRVFDRERSRMHSTGRHWPTGNRACRSPSILQRTGAMTAITPASRAMSARQVWPSIQSRT